MSDHLTAPPPGPAAPLPGQPAPLPGQQAEQLFTVESVVDPVDVAVLEERIRLETLARAGLGEPHELAVLVRDHGTLRAGAYGWTWGGTCELQHLWVEPALRRVGTGSRLLHLVEREAARRGCGRMVLFTHALQHAWPFYERHGYELVGRVNDYPAGDAALWYRKHL